MKTRFRWTIISCLVVIAISLFLYVNKMTTSLPLSNEELKSLGLYLIEPGRELGAFKLQDNQSEIFTPQDFKGKWNLIFFGFTYCPDICPITMRMLSNIEKEMEADMKKNIRFFMVTVDPDRDTPDKLNVYLKNFSNNFIGLTGPLDQIYNFATRVNAPFNPVSKSSEDFYTVEHTGSIVLVDPEGKYSGFFRTPHKEGNIKVSIRELLSRGG
mgnify:FL=1